MGLTIQEIRDGLQDQDLPIPDDLLQMMNGASDDSAMLDYTEFLAAALESRDYLSEDVCKTAFAVFDTSGNGRISQKELLKVLGDECSARQVRELVQSIDQDGDGFISFDDFMTMMTDTPMAGSQSETILKSHCFDGTGSEMFDADGSGDDP